MPKYTVQLGFADYYRNVLTVEAASVDDACEKAMQEDDDGWKSLCHAGDTFVDAVCEGENEANLWPDDVEARIPVPHKHTEAGLWYGVDRSRPVVIIEGGLVQDVLICGQHVPYVVRDYTVEGVDPEIEDIQTDSNGREFVVSESP